jgi:hypothetical protein
MKQAGMCESGVKIKEMIEPTKSLHRGINGKDNKKQPAIPAGSSA